MNNRQASARTAGSVGPAIDFQASEASSSKVLALGGHTLPISQPLVKAVPSYGWRVPVKVNDLSYTITGSSAHDAFNRVQTYLIQNGVNLSPLNIWLHLNLHWLPKVTVQQRRVSIQALQAVQRETQEAVIERQGYGPPVYGGVLWGTAGLYLVVSAEEYQESEMRSIFDTWDKLFLSKESIGCPECSEHWLIAYSEADISTRAKARDFLVNTQNEIRTRQERHELTFKELAEAYKWTLNL